MCLSQDLKTIQFEMVNKSNQKEAREIILDGMREQWGVLDLNFNHDLDNIYENYLVKGDIFLLGIYKNRVVCTGALQKEMTFGRIVRMSVKKEWRKKGFGTIMLQKLLTIARDANYEKVVVETTKTWKDAIYFYKKNGFEKFSVDKFNVHFMLVLH